jgi:hypothetical protein
MGLDFDTVTDSGEIMTFKLVIKFIWSDNLMQYKLDLIILTKTKEIIRYCESHAYSGKVALNNVTNNLTYVSVPTEDGWNMSLRDQHFCAHSCP